MDYKKVVFPTLRPNQITMKGSYVVTFRSILLVAYIIQQNISIFSSL